MVGAAAIGITALTQAVMLQLRGPLPAMFLAPMIGVIEPCILLQNASGDESRNELVASCTGPDGSAAMLVEATLSGFSPRGTPQRYPLGYTLNVPLLQLFKKDGDGWVIDKERVQRLVRTVRDTERPAILYLFSTHFASGAPIEEALGADPANLSQTPRGPLLTGAYYSSPIYNWSFATTRTDITARRVQAAQAVLDEVCKLEDRHIARIRGVTLLGELHHLFPDFQGGMGFSADYLVSDYSPASREGFRAYLGKQYRTIGALNHALGTDWTSFEQVEPPSGDIRRDQRRHLTEHIDSFAHGSLPISGWIHVKNATQSGPARIRIYRNGDLIGRTTASLGRQDVLEALPELGDANTGWRFDMDFRKLPTGQHRIDVFLEGPQETLVHLATRQIAIMDRQQTQPTPQPQRPLPASSPAGPEVRAYLDLPADLSSYYYNPLVAHWHAYRGQQVVDYLQFFNRLFAKSCLAETPRYTHQIIPFSNPGWDGNKFAIDASLEPMEDLRLGVSLYGEAAYGASFANWLAGKHHLNYGVTEFHPLKAMDAAQIRAVLDQHAQQGARFVSFFLEPRWHGKLVPRGHNIFSFDPGNDKFGSSELYRSSAQAAGAGPPAPPSGSAPRRENPSLPMGARP